MAQSSFVEVRRYEDLGQFQADAAAMAALGWKIASQSTGSTISGAGVACGVLGFVAILAGFLVSAVLLVIGVVFLIIGLVARKSVYTVTYQWQTQ